MAFRGSIITALVCAFLWSPQALWAAEDSIKILPPVTPCQANLDKSLSSHRQRMILTYLRANGRFPQMNAGIVLSLIVEHLMNPFIEKAITEDLTIVEKEQIYLHMDQMHMALGVPAVSDYHYEELRKIKPFAVLIEDRVASMIIDSIQQEVANKLRMLLLPMPEVSGDKWEGIYFGNHDPAEPGLVFLQSFRQAASYASAFLRSERVRKLSKGFREEVMAMYGPIENAEQLQAVRATERTRRSQVERDFLSQLREFMITTNENRSAEERVNPDHLNAFIEMISW